MDFSVINYKKIIVKTMVIEALRVGKKVVIMSIDRAGGQYWLKPVNTGRLQILWSINIIKGFFPAWPF
jgi:hypothetical protein